MLLSGVTDPTIVLTLRTKLDTAGHYDDFEIDRVVNVVLSADPKQSQLEAAIRPVAERLLNQYAAAKLAYKAAMNDDNEEAAKPHKEAMDALQLFKSDMATYQRVYTFLSQMIDYANTDFEKRAIFVKYLIRLLKFGREREGLDLSQVVLTHHTLRSKGKQSLKLPDTEYPKLNPLQEAGSGSVQEKEKAFLTEIIAKVNDLFKGELTDNDKLIYVNNVIMGKLLESATLVQQAANNTKEQFANSPDLKTEILNAIINALDAHTEMSTQALGSESIQKGLRDILLGPANLYERLRPAG